MRTFRILQVFGTMNRGGAELRTLETMRLLDRTRFAFDFWAVSSQRGDLDAEIVGLGGKVYYARAWAGRWVSLLIHLLRNRYDAIHSNVYLGSGLVLAISALAGVPVRIAHFRTTRDGKPSSFVRRLYRRCMRALLERYATHLLAVSEGAMSAAWGANWRDDSRCQVIYSGIDCSTKAPCLMPCEFRSEFGFPADSYVVLHIGRVMAAKNHERLLSVFATLLRHRENSRLLIVGRHDDSQLLAQLKSKAVTLGISAKIAFAGLQSDVNRILAGADIMIFPSIWEGMPGAVLEAAAAGLPVLSSDIPGSLEIMRHVQGIRCLPLQEPDAEWARVAENMLRERMNGTFAHNLVRGTVFDSAVSTNRFADFYEESITLKTSSPQAFSIIK